MTKYTIERDEAGCTFANCDGKVVRKEFNNGEYFVQLETDSGDDCYWYSWKHANGKGKFKIPAHIFYDIPELASILNHASEYRIFDTCRIYIQEPIANLFPNGDIKNA